MHRGGAEYPTKGQSETTTLPWDVPALLNAEGGSNPSPPPLPHRHASYVVYATGEGSLFLEAPIRFFPINMNAPDFHGSPHKRNASARLAPVSDSAM